ncbi:MAG: hypothetical protein M9911_05420 [Saprospiraceae bacterium]|nr:hypothetical protein [Saprospiraceae bacterium]
MHCYSRIVLPRVILGLCTKNKEPTFAEVVEDIHAIHPELSAKIGSSPTLGKYYQYKRQCSLSALGIDEAAWSALLAKYPGKRFEIEALFVNPKFSIL